MGSHRTGGIIKFTIEPNLFYAAKSMKYNYNRTHITSSAFIQRPNKNYYVGSGTVVELPDSPKMIIWINLLILIFIFLKIRPEQKYGILKKKHALIYLVLMKYK
ncbi:hypothetical protein AKG16_15780 [Morganella morganii]|nr:hypothetical protein AKG16_15780 [Morganella morganii]